MFKYWSCLEFDHYRVMELRSYQYLEHEEPKVIQSHFSDKGEPRKIPSYESVNILRLARNNKRITPKDVELIHEDVFEAAREPKEIRAHPRRLCSDREVKEPAELRKPRRNAAIQRLVSVLTRTRRELEAENFLPAYLLNPIDDPGKKLEDQIER